MLLTEGWKYLQVKSQLACLMGTVGIGRENDSPQEMSVLQAWNRWDHLPYTLAEYRGWAQIIPDKIFRK